MRFRTFKSSLATIARRLLSQERNPQCSRYCSMALVCTKRQFEKQVVNPVKGLWYNCTLPNPPQSCLPPEDRKPIFTKIFQRGKRYLIQLINSSTSSGLIFTIDNHLLEIIDTDFVPIHPFKNESIHVAIGEPLCLHTRILL